MKATVKALNNDGVYLSNQCFDFFQAIEYFQRALIMYKQHDRLWNSYESFACNQENLRILKIKNAEEKSPLKKTMEPDEGLYQYTRTLAIAILTSDNDEKDDEAAIDERIFYGVEAILCFNLGVCYLLSDQDQESCLYFSKTEAILETQGCIYNSSSEISGHQVVPYAHINDAIEPFQLDIITLLHNKGLIHFRAKHYEKSLQYFIEAVAKSIGKHEAEDMSVAVALNAIGIILSRTTDDPCPTGDITRSYDEALAALNRSLHIRTTILGEDAGSDKETATVMNNIGRVHFLLNDLQEALKYHLDAYNIRKVVMGHYHFETGVAAFNAGQCYQSLRQPNEATRFYTIFVKSIFQSSILQRLSQKIVRAFEHIAVCFHNDGLHEHADPFYELAVFSAKKVFGPKDAYVAQLLNMRGNLFCEMCSFEKSLACYEEGLQIELDVYPFDHTNIITTEENIARVLREKNAYL